MTNQTIFFPANVNNLKFDCQLRDSQVVFAGVFRRYISKPAPEAFNHDGCRAHEFIKMYF